MPEYKVHWRIDITGVETVEADDELEAEDFVSGMSPGELAGGIDVDIESVEEVDG